MNTAPATATEAGRQVLAFGVPTLDELIGRANVTQGENQYGLALENHQTTSLCIIGPDGTGKSVLALHLASHYLASADPAARVFYISTDLSWDRAHEIWRNFHLRRPVDRFALLPFGHYESWAPRTDVRRVSLLRYNPIPADSDPDGTDQQAPYRMTRYLRQTEWAVPSARSVAFVDLEANSVGDDWGLVNRLLAMLDTPEVTSRHDRGPGPNFSGPWRHLVIIDAVEGLLTFQGDTDAFGQQRERRSRIAQVLRAAKGKCHVVFVVEEPRDRGRLPEEFVSDAVIRLRIETQRDYYPRTVEIEKLRGQHHIRGRHQFTIRRGQGSFTGEGGREDRRENPDDPMIILPDVPPSGSAAPVTPDPEAPVPSASDTPDPAAPDPAKAGGPGAVTKTMSYVHVFHSLHFQTREDMERQGGVETPGGAATRCTGLAGTGIEYLDTMLGDAGIPPSEQAPESDKLGVPWGSITALMGNDGTHKSRLGRAFLAKTFLNERHEFDESRGVAALLTVHGMDHKALASRLDKHYGRLSYPAEATRLDLLKERIVCRSLEVHHITPPVLIHIIDQLLRDAKRRLSGAGGSTAEEAPDPVDAKGRPSGPGRPDGGEAPDPGRIRLVIDDWSGIQAMYPEVGQDPLFLPYLIAYLRRQGVTSFIINTQVGRHQQMLNDKSDRELISLVDHHLYTWSVDFFGETRVAVAALPPVSDEQPVVVRELRAFSTESERLYVDPHFELYDGLVEGKPRHVPLKIHLFRSHEHFRPYFDRLNDTFMRVFDSEDSIIVPEDGRDYDHLRDYSNLTGLWNLDRTVVLQVDEFWSPGGRNSDEGGRGTREDEPRGRDQQEGEGSRGTLEDGPCGRDREAGGRRAREHEPSGRDSAKPLFEYFLARTADRYGTPNHAEDLLELFQPDSSDEINPYHRYRRYETVGYQILSERRSPARSNGPESGAGEPGSGLDAPQEPDRTSGAENRALRLNVDGIPFLVDFGFLLVRADDWRACAEMDLYETPGGTIREFRKVGEIWKELAIPPPDGPRRVDPDSPKRVDELRRIVPWRDFFQACRVIARHRGDQQHSRVAFDLDLTGIESISCLFLEVVFSELKQLGVDRLFAEEGWSDQPFADRPVGELIPPRRDAEALVGLDHLGQEPNVQLAMFRAWLLLCEFLEPDRFKAEDFLLCTRPASPEAVASRHWYSTATPAVSGRDPLEFVPIRNAGSYTCRGDWMLHIAAGSRSSRLGRMAADLLGSRRGNITRMQYGLGLPVRGFGEGRNPEFRSPLHGPGLDGRAHRLLLDDLWWLGGDVNQVATFLRPPEAGMVSGDAGAFSWLWRSRLRSYHRHCRILQKWLQYVLFDEATSSPSKRDSLDIYDGLAPGEPKDGVAGVAWRRFRGYCNELTGALRGSTPRGKQLGRRELPRPASDIG